MFKDSKIEFSDDTIVIADSGYQGLQKIHEKTLIPIKKSKNKPLNTKEKDFNKLISKIRVPVEHIFG
jgi:putative transposase